MSVLKALKQLRDEWDNWDDVSRRTHLDEVINAVDEIIDGLK